MKNLTYLLLACWLFPQLLMAEVYKWVDETGKTHFGDKAPEKTTAENISQSVEKTNLDTSIKNTKASFSDSGEKTVDEIEIQKQQEAEKQAAIEKPCRKLKKDIDVIASGKSVAFFDKDGKEYNVPEADRSKKLEEWKAFYKKLGCK